MVFSPLTNLRGPVNRHRGTETPQETGVHFGPSPYTCWPLPLFSGYQEKHLHLPPVFISYPPPAEPGVGSKEGGDALLSTSAPTPKMQSVEHVSAAVPTPCTSPTSVSSLCPGSSSALNLWPISRIPGVWKSLQCIMLAKFSKLLHVVFLQFLNVANNNPLTWRLQRRKHPSLNQEKLKWNPAKRTRAEPVLSLVHTDRSLTSFQGGGSRDWCLTSGLSFIYLSY